MTNTSPATERKSVGTIRRLLENPFVSGVGWLVGIMSLPLAIYMYLVPHRHRDLSYMVHPAKAVIVKTGQLSRLSVSLDGNAVTTDVTAAQVAFWNEGNESIRAEHVLQPLRIKVNVPIVDATIRRPARDVVRLALDKTQMARGELGVTWNILEGGDGGSVQIVFAGGPDVHVTADAVIEDQPVIRKLEVREENRDVPYSGRRPKLFEWSPWLVLVSLGWAILPLIALAIGWIRGTNRTRMSVLKVFWVVLRFAGFIAGLGLLRWLASPAAPPFDF